MRTMPWMKPIASFWPSFALIWGFLTVNKCWMILGFSESNYGFQSYELWVKRSRQKKNYMHYKWLCFVYNAFQFNSMEDYNVKKQCSLFLSIVWIPKGQYCYRRFLKTFLRCIRMQLSPVHLLWTKSFKNAACNISDKPHSRRRHILNEKNW